MAKQVKSFNEIIAFVQSFKIEETDAIHIAEQFMDAAKISFDADGNFDPVNIDFSEADKKVKKA
ncbi:MAG: hypothetical protein JW904_06210 [Spirochaetales bacterium]|nr:hypothetical protein [Spirochaetales bacterium]